VQATRAALEEGIVPGGGVALLNAVEAIKLDDISDADERTGAQIIKRALEEPIRQLAFNGGLEASVVVDKVRNAGAGMGLNVDTGEVEDLVKAGIIDPTMVTRSALQNAASIAKNILMTEAIVAEPPESRSRHGGRHGRHGRRGRNDVTRTCSPSHDGQPGPARSTDPTKLAPG
jgi:chaperonin GroEL